MNYRGSYRHLLRNSRAALTSSVEIYNKPRFEYRDECSVILLLNSWELLLKAILSKHGHSIYYPKRRGEPYRTLSAQDAMNAVLSRLPAAVGSVALRRNLDLLSTYRNNAVHFYNAKGFGSVIYALTQAAIVNYREVARSIFGLDIADDLSWVLLPLGRNAPLDPVEYMQRDHKAERGAGAVRQFLSEVADAVQEVEAAGQDTSRLLTVFTVKLESVKKVDRADVVVGVAPHDAADAATSAGPLAIVKTSDPNVTHPLRQKEVLAELTELHGRPFTSNTFQAIVWHKGLRQEPRYCWEAREGVLTRYSRDVLPFIRGLTTDEVTAAVSAYRAELTRRAEANAATRAASLQIQV